MTRDLIGERSEVFMLGLILGPSMSPGFPHLKVRMETDRTFVYGAVSLAQRLRGAGLRCLSSKHMVSLGGCSYMQSKNFTQLS